MFSPESTQADVFETIQPLIADVLAGYNATVFAYGQTGTGKTHTMEGRIDIPGEEGIIPRSVGALFDGVAEADEHIEFTFKVSYVEIYMEKIRDLLDPNRLKNNLTVREDKINGIYIAGVTEEYVTSFEELLNVMQSGAFNRATAATGMNEGSSRSHSVFTITIGQKDLSNACAKSGKLVLVDLAGSEMVRKTGASGQQLEEAKTINKSLSALGQVINALTDKNQQHVPYRDSKLTRVLQDSLGGNSKTVLIVAISPSSYNANETLSTIRFGLRAKAIENKVTVNATRSVEELEALLERAEKAIDVQAGHIVTLTAKLQEFANGDVSFESEASSEAGTTPVQSPQKRAPSAEHVALLESLQDTVNRLTADLDDSTQDSITKAGELDEMGILLKDKERLLYEAGDLLQEARKHYEAQRERSEVLIKEKAEMTAQIERLQDSMGDELENLRFQLKEAKVSAETLQAENKQLTSEITEISGDAVPVRNRESISNTAGGTMGAPAPPARRASTVAITTIIKTDAERQSNRDYTLKSFEALCTSLHVPTEQAKLLVEQVRKVYDNIESEVLVHESRTAAIERAQADTTKRVKELETQRARLESDLTSRTESAVKAKLDLENFTAEVLQNASADPSIKPASDKGTLIAMHERERLQNKSLQQRLEQLVAVHRQLLRKFASLELDASDVKKKLTLRDERIYQLETNARSTISNTRVQSERHVAELTNLREQIRLMKEEHLQRKDQQQHYMDLQLLVGRENSNGSGPRKMRGGHSAAAENTATIGRPKSISGGNRLSLSGGSITGSPSGGSSSFSSMMARLGVTK
jgi:kinesin family member 5